MKVLLVDPVADLLPSLQNALLSVNGLELYCAPDGATAVQHSKLLGGVDLLITEITAPDVDGLSLSAELRRSLPGLKTVFLTRKIPGAHAATPRGSVVLGIPVDPEKVLSAIQSPAPTREVIDVPHVLPARNELSSTLGQENQRAEKPPAKRERGIDDESQPVQASDTTDPLTPKGAEKSAALKSRFEIIRHSIDPSESVFSAESNEPAEEEWPQFEIVDQADSIEPLDAIAPLHPGARLGAYHILREDSPHLLGQSFAAVHTTLGRTVHLIVLDAAFETNIETKSVFIADAAAKASAHHPGLLAVYEAGEIEGRTFYALERLEAETIANLLERRATLSSNVLREIAKTVSEVMIYFQENRMTRESLRAENILVTIDGIARLKNIATGGLQEAIESFEELSALSKWLMALLPEQTPSTLRVVCDRISRSHPDAILDFKTFLGAIHQASPGRQSQNRPGSHVPARKPKQPSIAQKGLLAAACALIIAAITFHNLGTRTQQVPRQVEIPAGQYIVGSGKRVALEAFTIDFTEVSNRQYFEFIAWLRSHPNDASRYDHPEQTPQHSHIPPGWNEQFPEKSGPRKSPEDSRWELPVTQITWWDAYAFASWAGRSLPTEEQWEAAGRGTRGFLFPWGDEPEPERTNVAKPESKRTGEDSNMPRPVMALMDKSTMGVSALAGNVSEWTSTNRDGKYAVKGSHFNGPLVPLDYSPVFSPDTRMPHLGFRTTSAPPPSSHP